MSSAHETEYQPYLQPGGFKNWFFTVDHKRIGLMYLYSILTFFLVAGLCAMAVRTELLFPGSQLFDHHGYNVLFTLHGAIMVFLFIVPGIPATLGNFLLPIMIGAKDVAFPRLNLISYWIYIVGALIVLYSLMGFLPAVGAFLIFCILVSSITRPLKVLGILAMVAVMLMFADLPYMEGAWINCAHEVTLSQVPRPPS